MSTTPLCKKWPILYRSSKQSKSKYEGEFLGGLFVSRFYGGDGFEGNDFGGGVVDFPLFEGHDDMGGENKPAA